MSVEAAAMAALELPGPLTAQEVARMRRAAENPTEEHGEPSAVEEPPSEKPPLVSPPEEISPPVEKPPLAPKSAFIKVHKTVMSFAQSGHTRRFLVKDWGTPEAALAVAEEFSKHIAQVRSDFDHLAKKPDKRHTFLMKYGWEEGKSCKRNLPEQWSFVLQALCGQQQQQLEAHLSLTGLRTTIPDLGEKGCTLTHGPTGFTARVRQSKDVFIEKVFESLAKARQWFEHVTAVKDGCSAEYSI